LTLTHHDLCFGCGSANLFGLQMELEQAENGAVSGRFFAKQDHQGPGGAVHAGVIASALEEAMGLALHARGVHARARRLEVELLSDVPVGTFVDVSAHVENGGSEELTVAAVAVEDGRRVAEARGAFAIA
jgi:acyl-coenzyme A thioesterase PaaI-like protein